MLFNSLHYLIFFPIVLFVYFQTPQKYRWLVLLLASYYFYMCWVPVYIVFLLIATLIDFFCGLGMSQTRNPLVKRLLLGLSLAFNLGLLLTFKYYNFFAHHVFALSWPTLNWIVPLGISFHVFQSLSYTIDVYRGEFKPIRHIGIFALYVCFFPQLVAGPIERPHQLIWQFTKDHSFDYQRITGGLKLIAWGIFKKMVIADRLAALVDKIYYDPHSYHSLTLLVATFFFTFQIYCDFSGYTDMARGSARVLGFELVSNFERPYFSQSIGEFWRRWHISLSRWFRDYVYIPIGGSFVSLPRHLINLIVVFLISGLWHGANWTFIIWGGLHGFYLVCSHLTKSVHQKFDFIPRIFKIIFIFLLVMGAWIFFRAENLNDAFFIFQKISILPQEITSVHLVSFLFAEIELSFSAFALNLGLIALLLIAESSPLAKFQVWYANQPGWIRWFGYYSLVFTIIILGQFEESPFVYFQF